MNALIIDDNTEYLQVLRAALTKRNINSTVCSDRGHALEYASDKGIDMVICDYFMPQIDGGSLLKEIGEFRKDCTLVLTSSYPIGICGLNEGRIKFVDKKSLLDFILSNFLRESWAHEVTP